VDTVVQVVSTTPGLGSGELRKAVGLAAGQASNDAIDDAIQREDEQADSHPEGRPQAGSPRGFGT